MADSTTTDRLYDRYQRSPEARAFYNSSAWKRARNLRATTHPICERCRLVVGELVHHIIELEDCTPEQKLAQSNLKHVCRPCHNLEHADMRNPNAAFVSGQLEAVEDDEYRYDEQRGTAVERFALRYCNHWRGSIAGKPFALHALQTAILRPVYGLVSRSDELRRFNFLWLETGIGSGKTPVMAICGLEHLLGGSEPGAQIYSISNAFGTAKHTFEAAKTFIKNDPSLSRLVDRGKLTVNAYEMHYKPTDSRWLIVSGKGKRAGAAASMILADEIHQIDNRDLYDDLQGRMTKREQPLVICATNAAKKPEGLYTDLHELAVDTLTNGPRANRRFYPVIWAAPPEAEPSDPETWKLANKMIGVTIKESDVADKFKEAEGSPALMARFRLQYCSQQVSDISRWLDLARWDACSAPLDPAKFKGLPLYVGVDLALRSDLCAITYVYLAPDRYYVDVRFYTPRVTAQKYQDEDDVPFISKWSQHITLLSETTINAAVQERIANDILDVHKAHKITAVAYDRAYSEHCIARLIAAGLDARKVPQGWGVSTGCKELNDRLKAGTITITPSPILRFCAENTCVKHDERGNYWPIKVNARGSYAGKADMKIDGIQSLVTNLTEARKHEFPRHTRPSSAGALLI